MSEELCDALESALIRERMANAEIERLKDVLGNTHKFIDAFDARGKLVTEMADWIESLWPALSWGSDDSTMGRVRKVIKRAREATK